MSKQDASYRYLFSWEQGKRKKDIKPDPEFVNQEEALGFHPNADLPSYDFLKYKKCDHLTLKCFAKDGSELFSKSWRPKHYSIANDWAWVQNKEKWVDNRCEKNVAV